MSSDSTPGTEIAPRWEPLSSMQRRILGTLVEKAKTTPDAYPLSLNALVTGCNQKSNRDPQMNLDPHQVEDALEVLRQKGAVGEVQGGGRVPRYRHYMKDWLGVDGVELAVMTELLLRGEQTIGELRGRASRMAPIADVSALQPVLANLEEKGLLVPLTPAGRGQMVAHTLYQPQELERIKAKHGTGGDARLSSGPLPEAPRPAVSAPPQGNLVAPAPSPVPVPPSSPRSGDDVSQLRRELAELREEVARLKGEVEDIWSNLR